MLGSLISPELLDSIDERIERLDENDRQECVHLASRKIKDLGIAESTSMDADNRRHLDSVIDNYHKALAVGTENYSGTWEDLFLVLQEVAGSVEPVQRAPGQSYAPFRKGSTAIPGMSYVPPSDEQRIRAELEKVRDFVTTKPLHPVEEGSFLYFHIARTQPFEHGNKRTASVIQNLAHEDHGYPYVAVGPKDHKKFVDRFARAIDGYRQDMSSGYTTIEFWNIGAEQRQFFEAWGRRTLSTIEAVEHHVAEIPRYKLTVRTKEPGREFAVKKALQSRLQFNGDLCEIHLKRSEHAIYVSTHQNPANIADIAGSVGQVKFELERLD